MSLFRHPSQTVRIALVLLCVLVVMMRISGAHLHLCLDGSEPPAAMHFDNDAGMHHMDEDPHSATATHSDMDVNLVTDALVKKSSNGFDLLVLLAVFVVFLRFLPMPLQLLPLGELLLPVTAHRAHLRPLLRGPPL